MAPQVAYVTRSNTTGGATPTTCGDNTATVYVPYTAVFRWYFCPGAAPAPAPVAPSSALGLGWKAGMVALAVAVHVLV
jgi:hypothetical protein